MSLEPMNFDMPLPEILKSERKKRNFSLQEVQQKTRVPVRFLQAMEEGLWDAFPAEVYRAGFLKDYAEFLKLDTEAVLRQYRQETHSVGLNKPEKLAVDVSLEKIKMSPATPKNFRVVILFLAVAGAVLGAWKIGRHFFKRAAVPVKVENSIADKNHFKPEEGLYLLSLKVSVNSPLWMRVQGDGKLIFEGHVQPGGEHTWNAVHAMGLRLGNSRAIAALSLNGKSFRVQPRPKSAIVELMLNQETLKDIENRPDPVLQSLFLSTQSADVPDAFSPPIFLSTASAARP